MLVSMSLVLLVTTHWKYFVFFFFQAEDGIRDIGVTGVQTCALPISSAAHHVADDVADDIADARLLDRLIGPALPIIRATLAVIAVADGPAILVVGDAAARYRTPILIVDYAAVRDRPTVGVIGDAAVGDHPAILVVDDAAVGDGPAVRVVGDTVVVAIAVAVAVRISVEFPIAPVVAAGPAGAAGHAQLVANVADALLERAALRIAQPVIAVAALERPKLRQLARNRGIFGIREGAGLHAGIEPALEVRDPRLHRDGAARKIGRAHV